MLANLAVAALSAIAASSAMLADLAAPTVPALTSHLVVLADALPRAFLAVVAVLRLAVRAPLTLLLPLGPNNTSLFCPLLALLTCLRSIPCCGRRR